MSRNHRGSTALWLAATGVVGLACGSPSQSAGNDLSPTISATLLAAAPITADTGVTPAAPDGAVPTADARAFVNLVRQTPVWQTTELPFPGYDAYVQKSNGLLVGRLVALEGTRRTVVNGAVLGGPDVDVVLVSVLIRVEVESSRSALEVVPANSVLVPVAVWFGGLPPDWDKRESQLVESLGAVFPVGAEVGVLVSSIEGEFISTVENGVLPSLAAITIADKSGLLNLDPTIDSAAFLDEGLHLNSIDDLVGHVRLELT